MANGTCKLTGRRGKYVKSHIIPKALTYPGPEGLPFNQGGSGQYMKRRWDSWYDPKLVIAEGEAILSDIDDWAVRYLRDLRLVWSGWGPMLALGLLHRSFPGADWGLRIFDVAEPERLRLFFHSLLWRAAASELPEFEEIQLPPQDLEDLRKAVVGDSITPVPFYPVTLVQLSTLGMIHNLSPFADEKLIPGVGGNSDRSIPIFRFYFDGLVAHFHRQSDDDGYTKSLGQVVVGQTNKLAVATISFEKSFQYENLQVVVQETLTR